MQCECYILFNILIISMMYIWDLKGGSMLEIITMEVICKTQPQLKTWCFCGLYSGKLECGRKSQRLSSLSVSLPSALKLTAGGCPVAFCFIVMAIDALSKEHSIGNKRSALGLNKEGEGRLPKATEQGPLLHALGYLEALEMFLPPILRTCSKVNHTDNMVT